MEEIYCMLEDCNKYECHNCFPVKNCSFNHEWCQKNGTLKEIFIKKNENTHFNEIDIDIKNNLEEIILVTGCAGFIGSHTCEYLLNNNYFVIGIDNINNYYDVHIKEKNIKILQKYEKFKFFKEDILNTTIISKFKPNKIIHLAAMAGVRYSIENPKLYCDVNIKGFIHLLEECVKNKIKHIVYASSSSVYGLNDKIPFSENDMIENCNSPYACSKMAMELYAKMYTQLHDISCIGLRFFTVYGPRGRPDMAPYKFMTAIMNDNLFEKYGNGDSARDYTYIDDIVQGIFSALINKNNKKCEIYNLGNSSPITLNEFIETCEKICNKKAKFNKIKEQLGDVPITFANIEKAKNDLDYCPQVKLEDGLKNLYYYLKNI